MNGRVLIVEDEVKIAAVTADYLHAAGFETNHVVDGREALRQFAQTPADVVVLDLMLPGLDGLEVCRALRAGPRPDVGIVMVTARVDEVERLLGLETGADDYLCKPFSPRELVARVRALMRRLHGRGGSATISAKLWQTMHSSSVPPAQGLAIDEATQRAFWQGKLLPLTPVEWRLLRTLAAHEGRVFSRAQLLNASHDDFRDVGDRAVDSHIKNLRRKLQASGPGADGIESVYGVGYRLTLAAE